jgi:hypothetical protein
MWQAFLSQHSEAKPFQKTIIKYIKSSFKKVLWFLAIKAISSGSWKKNQKIFVDFDMQGASNLLNKEAKNL